MTTNRKKKPRNVPRHAAYPVGLVTRGRRLLIVGGGPETRDRLADAIRFDWKSIHLVTLSVADDLRCLATADPRVKVVERPVRESDVRTADVVIEGCGDPATVEKIHDWCLRHRRPLNAMDSPAHCDFYVTSYFARGPLLISIVSGGFAPALTAVLRRRLEQAIGPGWQTAACLMAAARLRLPSGASRRVLMKAIAKNPVWLALIDGNDRAGMIDFLDRTIAAGHPSFYDGRKKHAVDQANRPGGTAGRRRR